MHPIRSALLAVALLACATEPPSAQPPAEAPPAPPARPALPDAPATDTLIVRQSPHDMPTTIQRAVQAVHRHELRMVTVHEHSYNPEVAQSELPEPTAMLLFGKPDADAKLIRASRALALELPFKGLIWQEGDDVHVAWHPPSKIAARYGVDLAELDLADLDATIASVYDDAIGDAPIPPPPIRSPRRDEPIELTVDDDAGDDQDP